MIERRWQFLVCTGLVSIGLLASCGPNKPRVEEGNGSDTSQGGTPDGGQTGDSGDPASSVDSGIAEDENVGALEASQMKQVCKAGENYLLDNLSKELVCRMSAHIFTALQQPETDSEARDTCSSLQSRCVSSERTSTCEGISGGEECDVEVSQWEDCEQALADRFAQRARSAPQCAETTTDYYSGLGGAETPEACEPLESSCPSFYGTWVGPLKSGGNSGG